MNCALLYVGVAIGLKYCEHITDQSTAIHRKNTVEQGYSTKIHIGPVREDFVKQRAGTS